MPSYLFVHYVILLMSDKTKEKGKTMKRNEVIAKMNELNINYTIKDNNIEVFYGEGCNESYEDLCYWLEDNGVERDRNWMTIDYYYLEDGVFEGTYLDWD